MFAEGVLSAISERPGRVFNTGNNGQDQRLIRLVDSCRLNRYYATLETLQVNKLRYFEYVHLHYQTKTGLFTGV